MGLGVFLPFAPAASPKTGAFHGRNAPVSFLANPGKVDFGEANPGEVNPGKFDFGKVDLGLANCCLANCSIGNCGKAQIDLA